MEIGNIAKKYSLQTKAVCSSPQDISTTGSFRMKKWLD